MRRGLLFLVCTVALGAIAADAEAASASTPIARRASRSFAARGVVKSFGPGRAFVTIAHEDIPGFMAAMTMPFEAKAPGQLETLAAGDRVAFTFTELEDGRLVLEAIAKS